MVDDAWPCVVRHGVCGLPKPMPTRLAARGPRQLWRDDDVKSAQHGTVDSWMIGGKVSMGTIHGPHHTSLTRLRVLARSEEGGRRRCGAHQRGRRRRSSTTVKVSVLRVRVQLRALAKLLDLRTGREDE
jgi:hypothetical protein